ncbi:hypothetical protein, partial [Muribaculum intestinale]|uniref:hypothetical protein n=1 Tax=Muribaculum intestinale TaxID=1796646 RepID=UPI0025B2D5F7
LNNYFDLRKISASQNNSEDKSSVGSVSGLAKAEQPQILPNHCMLQKYNIIGGDARIIRKLLSLYFLENPLLENPFLDNILKRNKVFFDL